MPDEAEVVGLLALLLLTEARRDARVDAFGAPVLLPDQDRTRWDRSLIAEGHELVRWCLRRRSPGPYQFQAAIAAVHADAPDAASTDWRQILVVYDQLLAAAPSPVVALNRAVAVAEVIGPAAALELVDELDLDHYHPLHVVRAELLVRLERWEEAVDAFDAALERVTNSSERAHLAVRRAVAHRLSLQRSVRPEAT
jgi:RNA polymerase sigma-70 factor (ECF subfamily)